MTTLIYFILAGLCAWIWSEKGRSWFWGLVLGLAFPIVGIIVGLCISKKE